MKLKQISKFILATTLAMTTLPSFADGNDLYILNWTDYIAPDTIKNFEKETGIKVHYQVIDSNEILEAKMMAGGPSGYDIIPPSIHVLKRLAELNLLEELDKSKLPNYKNLDKDKMAKIAKIDPDNKYGIPYTEGSTGIGYNKEMVQAIMGKDFVVDSFDVFFKDEIASKLQKCGITFLDSPSDMICSTLIYKGLDPESVNPKDYQVAKETLFNGVKYVRYIHSSSYLNDLAAGEVCLSIGWAGDIDFAAQRAKEAHKGTIEYVIPKEGALTGYDMLAIPKDSKNKENAYKFLDYILRPEVMASITNYIRWANPNAAATQYVDKDIRENKGLYYTKDKLEKMHIVVPKDEVLRLMNKTWNEVRTHK